MRLFQTLLVAACLAAPATQATAVIAFYTGPAKYAAELHKRGLTQNSEDFSELTSRVVQNSVFIDDTLSQTDGYAVLQLLPGRVDAA